MFLVLFDFFLLPLAAANMEYWLPTFLLHFNISVLFLSCHNCFVCWSWDGTYQLVKACIGLQKEFPSVPSVGFLHSVSARQFLMTAIYDCTGCEFSPGSEPGKLLKIGPIFVLGCRLGMLWDWVFCNRRIATYIGTLWMPFRLSLNFCMVGCNEVFCFGFCFFIIISVWGQVNPQSQRKPPPPYATGCLSQN